jgi:uncharacterized membrane protein YtjA (UPF0391 family)
MLRWAFAFFLIAIGAALSGFGALASLSAGIAQMLINIFLVLFVVTLSAALMRALVAETGLDDGGKAGKAARSRKPPHSHDRGEPQSALAVPLTASRDQSPPAERV